MRRTTIVAVSLWVLSTWTAHAEDQPFITLYTTDTDSQGEREVEQWLEWKTGETGASYNDFLSRSELEYGITDDLQGSLYVNYEWSHLRSTLPPLLSEPENNIGASGELIYRLMNVYFDPAGLALYLEPSLGSDEREIETKILLQKNLFNDTLRCVLNVNFEDTWERRSGGWDRESAIEFDSGIAYNLTPEWSAGLEFDNERAFAGLVMGGPARELASAFFLGPTINYAGFPVEVTLGAQVQLPWSTSPPGNPGAVVGGFEAHAERFRLGLRLSHDL